MSWERTLIRTARDVPDCYNKGGRLTPPAVTVCPWLMTGFFLKMLLEQAGTPRPVLRETPLFNQG